MKRDYFFSDSQIDQIRDGAVNILNEIGVRVGRSDVIESLIKLGFRTDGKFVKIDTADSRKKLEPPEPAQPEPDPADAEHVKIKRTLMTRTSVYASTYENINGGFEPVTTQNNLLMGEFAQKVSKLWPNFQPACPGKPTEIPAEIQFLRQAANSFLRCENFSSFELTSVKTADYHFAICDVMGRTVKGLPVYVASPLHIGGESFDIALYCHKRIDDVYFTSMPSLGANTPLNLVAAYAQTLAENLGGAIIFEALTGVRTHFSTNVFTFDFRDLSMPFGTPEKLLLEWISDEVNARIHGYEYHGPGGADIHTNAVRCGIQACIEKTSVATAGALLGASFFPCVGTLAMDDTFSPVQLLLDLEMLQHVQKIADGIPNDIYGGDLVEEVRMGLNGGYIMSDRTLDNMHRYVWQPKFFSRKTFGAFRDKPFKPEIEKAKDLAVDLMRQPAVWKLDDDKATEIEKIYAAALKSLTK